MKIMFTGGGSSGHVTPNLSLIQALKNWNVSVFYCGSKGGVERFLINSLNIPYYAITTGKLHRYWSFKNFLTPFRLVWGIVESFLLFRSLKPDVLFSKGGFVAVPVVIGAFMNHIPVVIHESDTTPGLANRLSFLFAKLVCVTFPSTIAHFKNSTWSCWRPRLEMMVTGMPIREFLYHGERMRGLAFCVFNAERPVLLIMAGGLGSVAINNSIRRLLKTLSKTFQIVHLCGKGKIDQNPVFAEFTTYRQFEYLQEELADVLACADLVISRAGATSICELVALKKPHILLPLSREVSRGDQVENADYFLQQGLSKVLSAEEFSDERLLNMILDCYENLEAIKSRLSLIKQEDATQVIVKKLLEFGEHKPFERH